MVTVLYCHKSCIVNRIYIIVIVVDSRSTLQITIYIIILTMYTRVYAHKNLLTCIQILPLCIQITQIGSVMAVMILYASCERISSTRQKRG